MPRTIQEPGRMHFESTPLWGTYRIHLSRNEDARGFFVRTFCEEQFTQQGLVHRFVQSSMSFNRLKGTLRGMHYQLPPREETKLIQCIRGAVYDVLIDLRPQSPTFRQWSSFDLNESDETTLYVPAGIAHGYQTLTDDCSLLYAISEYYDPELSRGLRWNDRAFRIRWPMPPVLISSRDLSFDEWDGAGVELPCK